MTKTNLKKFNLTLNDLGILITGWVEAYGDKNLNIKQRTIEMVVSGADNRRGTFIEIWFRNTRINFYMHLIDNYEYQLHLVNNCNRHGYMYRMLEEGSAYEWVVDDRKDPKENPLCEESFLQMLKVLID